MIKDLKAAGVLRIQFFTTVECGHWKGKWKLDTYGGLLPLNSVIIALAIPDIVCKKLVPPGISPWALLMPLKILFCIRRSRSVAFPWLGPQYLFMVRQQEYVNSHVLQRERHEVNLSPFKSLCFTALMTSCIKPYMNYLFLGNKLLQI